MKKSIDDLAVWIALALLTFVLFITSCSDPMKDIVDGDKAKPEEHPHQVDVQKSERGITIDTSR